MKIILAFSALLDEKIKLSEPTLPSKNKLEGEPTARKLIIREMDHPMQILLFAGQVLNQDKAGMVEFVVNPLYGAIEIGYALKSIYNTLGFNKVDDIFMVKYSRYGSRDTIKESLAPFVPFQLHSELNKLKEKRILIVDDNLFSGNTLNELKCMCKRHSSKISVTAIEQMTEINKVCSINYDELNIKPISKLRYINDVLNYIKHYNMYGL